MGDARPAIPTAIHHQGSRWSLGVLITGIVLIAFEVVLAVQSPSFIVELDGLCYDTMLRSIDRASGVPETVIVDVDEYSLSRLGQWPWPRYQVARLIDTLCDSGARSVGVDFLFSEPDRLSLTSLRSQLSEDLQVTLNLEGIAEEALNNDNALAASFERANVAAALWFSFEQSLQADHDCAPPSLKMSVRRGEGAPEELPVPRAAGVLCPTPQLLASLQHAGFVNSLPDLDGKTRSMPLLIQYDGNVYPSLPLAACMLAQGEAQAMVHLSSAGIESVSIGKTLIPTDHQGNMLLDYRGLSGEFTYVSAADVLAGDVPGETFRGKVVFLGSSAAGLKDAHSTPLDRDIPGLEIHAIAAEGILRGDFLTVPAWALGAIILLVVVTGLSVAVLMARSNLMLCTAFTCAILAALWFGSRYLLEARGLFVSPAIPLMALLHNFLFVSLVRFRRDERRILRTVMALSSAQNCAILGITSIAETRDPETGRHIMRTQHYVRKLSEHLSHTPGFRKLITPEMVDILFRSAPLHDVGKVGIPDRVLMKPGRLTDDEYVQMKQHTTIGYRSLKHAQEAAGLEDDASSFLHYASEIALTHHEKWDGSGYPQGLKAGEIPVSGRIMAIADVYDALTSARCYKPPFSHEQAVAIISEGKGTHFDPEFVDAFLEINDSFHEIAVEYRDPEEEDE